MLSQAGGRLPSVLATTEQLGSTAHQATSPPATVESLSRHTTCHVFQSRRFDQAIEETWHDSCLVCPVCIERVCGGDEIRTLPCLHAFHRACIDSWFAKYHSTCPLCRTDVESVAWSDGLVGWPGGAGSHRRRMDGLVERIPSVAELPA